MCGIVGGIAQREIAPILLEGLRRLEYRGYDSAGMVTMNDQGQLLLSRSLGKVENLAQQLQQNPLTGGIGLAHTRWATHGAPSERNAHPHISNGSVAVVHNGIVENFASLRQELSKKGYVFESDTDTEVIAHLFHSLFKQYGDLRYAALAIADRLQGAFALGIVHTAEPTRLLALRHGSPLVIGLGIDEIFMASDYLALLPVTQRFIHLEDGDIADLSRDHWAIYDAIGERVERPIKSYQQRDIAGRGSYRHFMLKEIFEQPQALNETLNGRIDQHDVLPAAFGDNAVAIFSRLKRIHIVACGTSYHAAMVGRYWLEGLAQIPCQVEIASEFRYRKPVVEEGTLFLTLSQSGETADTLAALREAKQLGYLATLGICNVPESTLVREVDLSFITHAGPEMGVASTKAFTTQLLALLLFTANVKKVKQQTSQSAIVKAMSGLSQAIAQVLALDDTIKHLAEQFVDKQHALFLGRGEHYPIALEGALKLKELSYIHAEAYPAGELKHGPLALVDKEMPVIAVAPNNHLLEKLTSNLQEVHARGGQLYVFTEQADNLPKDASVHCINMPVTDPLLSPLVYTIPLQLLAYHVAVLKGTDVDQPRNLAKSVTVE
jgi:glutamine---fructose-6-phosphate transaminase (isomerizing)